MPVSEDCKVEQAPKPPRRIVESGVWRTGNKQHLQRKKGHINTTSTNLYALDRVIYKEIKFEVCYSFHIELITINIKLLCTL